MGSHSEAVAALEAQLGRAPHKFEINALKVAHRKVPMPEVQPGHCRWCERPIISKKGKHIGRPDPRRSWCRESDPGGRDCYHEFCLHSDVGAQFNWLEHRRGLRCAWCRVEDPKRWKSYPCSFGGGLGWEPPQMPWEGERRGVDYVMALCAFRSDQYREFPYGQAVGIERVSALEVDHIIPLWRVAMLTFESTEERRTYFGPPNLQLLCQSCHKIKTAREARERAAERAFAKAQPSLL